MADPNKKDFTVDVTIDPYGECKKKGEVPMWFAARPKLTKAIEDIRSKRSLTLDSRKWKQKDLDTGVYAVAKYDLAVFSTVLSTVQKDIDKAFDSNKARGKTKRDMKFYKSLKDETKEEKSALDGAEKKVDSAWKKVAKSINDKVSLALDEIEPTKGDNKKAIAVGKQALKVFERVDTKNMFATPIQQVTGTMKTLATSVAKSTGDTDPYFQTALRDLRNAESDFELVAKSTGKVAKMFLALGEKMSKDKNADGELQKFGEMITKGTIKSQLEEMNKNIKDLGKDMDMLVNFVAKGEHEAKDIAAKAAKFKGDHEKKKGSAAAATNEMRKLATEFKKIEKKLK